MCVYHLPAETDPMLGVAARSGHPAELIAVNMVYGNCLGPDGQWRTHQHHLSHGDWYLNWLDLDWTRAGTINSLISGTRNKWLSKTWFAKISLA